MLRLTVVDDPASQSVMSGKKLVMRRLRFCNSKINSLQSELNEALQLNMSGAEA